MIDSPVLPEELELLPSLLEQAGFPAPSGLLATHADWDHLLGPLAFPGLALGCAESSAARLRGRARARRSASCARFDEELLHRAPAAAGARRAPGAAGARSLRDRRRASSSCTRPAGTPPTAWRSSRRGRACSSPATTSRRSRSRRSQPRAARLAAPTSPRSSACARCWRPPSTSSPATARCSTRRAALRVLERGRRLPAGAARQGGAAELPRGAAQREQRALHAPNVERRR